MIGFSKHILRIAFMIFISMICLDIAYSYIYNASDSRYKLEYVIKEDIKNIDYIFLGSSRTESFVDCDEVTRLTGKSCLNLGVTGGDLTDAAALVSIIDERKITYKKIFIQVDYSYNSYDPSINMKAIASVYRNHTNMSLLARDLYQVDSGFSFPFFDFATFNQVLGLREIVFRVLNTSSRVVPIKNGYLPNQGTGSAVFGAFPTFIASSNQNIETVNKLKGNTVTYFTAPYCSEIENRDLFINLLQKRIPSLRDYSAIFDNNRNYFSDCGHVNDAGAKAFTALLIQDQ